jgi:hypothetical protein
VTGRTGESTSAWILVVTPPRERSRPQSSGSGILSFDRAPESSPECATCAGAVRTNMDVTGEDAMAWVVVTAPPAFGTLRMADPAV